jgi:hypothetical protein
MRHLLAWQHKIIQAVSQAAFNSQWAQRLKAFTSGYAHFIPACSRIRFSRSAIMPMLDAREWT